MALKYKNYFLSLIIVCVMVFILQVLIGGFSDIFLLNQESWLQPWRFLTAIFLHGGILHLIYNMFALFFFGIVLERTIGSRRFLAVFLTTGILANLVSINFYDSSLGASGAIFGIIGALIVLKPKIIVWAFGLPMPLFVAGILWVAGDLIGIFTPSNVANIAHLSGMGFGLIIGSFYRKFVYRNLVGEKREKLKLEESSMRRWEDDYLRR